MSDAVIITAIICLTIIVLRAQTMETTSAETREEDDNE